MSYTGQTPDTEPAFDWRHLGACSGHDYPDMWYATASSVAGRADQNEAQAICYGCPVLQPCGQWALETREQWGVWGGMTEAKRRSVLRRRGVRLVNADPDVEVTVAEVQPRNKGGRPRAECGTASAYDRHVRNGEPIDDACRTAHAADTAQYRRTRNAKASA